MEESRSILITTYNSHSIIPELLGFVNFDTVSYYHGSDVAQHIHELRERCSVSSADELWIIKTGDDNPADVIELSKSELPLLRYWYPSDISDIDSLVAVETMKELIFRAIFTAHQYSQGGKVYLSLTGGRKTMSSDMQLAASFFGADLLFHIIQKESQDNHPSNFFPVIVDMDLKPKEYLADLGRNEFFLDLDDPRFDYDKKISLVEKVNERRRTSEYLLTNYQKQLQEEIRSNFRELYFLPPELIIKLKSYKVGSSEDSKDKDLALIRKLPKAELHYHLGGAANPEEIIQIAAANRDSVDTYSHGNRAFRKWIDDITSIVRDIDPLEPDFLDLPKYKVRNMLKGLFSDIPNSIIVSAFILCFERYSSLFKRFIYDESLKHGFFQIGIDEYQKLGDFQGSALLQTEEALREVCRVVKKQAEEHNILYSEIRCSPEKYTREGLTAEQVVAILMEEFSVSKSDFRIIFIGSRHVKIEELRAHVRLAQTMLAKHMDFQEFFVGFDLAGSESATSPKDLRDEFLPLMENGVNLTIHAGEDMHVRSIWEAVYYLNADRIGHGLSLKEDQRLLRRFIERNIAIEMCPSSNYQIVGFQDRFTKDPCEDSYPLKEYLDTGLRITINTDDPGISLTNLTNEYYKAACMTNGGLSLWDVLLIIRNGFRAAFLPAQERATLLKQAEKQIIAIVQKEISCD